MIDRSIPSEGTEILPHQESMGILLAKNTLNNLLTQGLILILALVTLPHIIHGFSSDEFALLTIVWAFLGYFSLLDFGISRAITKYLSEARAARDSRKMVELVWSSLWISLFLGLIGGAILWMLSPYLVRSVLKISPALIPHALLAFEFASICIPFTILLGVIRAFQVALQRFVVVNLFQAILGVTQWLGPVVLLQMNFGLPEVILLTVGARILLSIVAVGTLNRLIPGSMAKIHPVDRPVAKELFSFGGWITLSQLISPMFLYVDRFFIGILVSLTAVTYYAIPQEALTRLLIIPMSLTTTLFPALSERSVEPLERVTMGNMYARSVKYLLLLILPVILFLFVGAPDILSVWVGPDLSAECSSVFQILAIGMLFNGLAQVPTTVLHAVGRPDITAKLHLAEFPAMILLNLALIPSFGIIGAAMTWTIRVTADAALLFISVHRIDAHVFGGLRTILRKKRITVLVIGLLALLFLTRLVPAMGFRIGLLCAILVGYVWAIWSYYLDGHDRRYILEFRSHLLA